MGFCEQGKTGPGPQADDLFFGEECLEELLERLVTIPQAQERGVTDRYDSA